MNVETHIDYQKDKEKIMEGIRNGDYILAFTGFPLVSIPKMTPLRIERLSANEANIYKDKLMHQDHMAKTQDWKGIHKFIVKDYGIWYLVRIYES